MLYSVSSYVSLPQEPGVYLLKNANGDVLYVGKAKQLRNRVSSYFANPSVLIGKTAALVEQVTTIETIVVESELESLLLEANLIKKYAPKYNIRLTDGKAYPLIRITLGYKNPAVLTARRPEDKKSVYLGPYPSATAMKMVLRILRRIFPFQSTFNHPPKVCLYHHLGLCPCVSAFPTEEHKKAYKKTLKHIVDFLEGKTKQVITDLEKERENASKAEDFEKAAALQKQIDAILYVIQPKHNPFEYEVNPNLRSDLREQELKELQTILAKQGVHIDFPSRIECYDNSNIQGTNPVASMVVLTDGEIDKTQYRKFKIKTVKGPNDFASMQEVFTRRLKHTEWSFPQLFIVDGGKGQVSAAREILLRHAELVSASQKNRDSGSEAGMTKSIPLIGLAKREEIIITSDLKEIRLPKNSKALQLIMKIRDEAHRFAITFHRKLRSKNALV